MHFIKHLIQDGSLILEYIPTIDQVLDMFTKPFASPTISLVVVYSWAKESCPWGVSVMVRFFLHLFLAFFYLFLK